MEKETSNIDDTTYKDVEILLKEADMLISNTISNINYELIKLYWNIGKLIFEYKQINNSKYGDNVVRRFSKELYAKHGAGFDRSNIYKAIKFYAMFSNQKVAPARLFRKSPISWSHIVQILKINNIEEIQFYLNDVSNKNLTKLELKDYIKTKSFERTVANQRESPIKNQVEKTLKDPLILKISNHKRTEKELENEIMINIFDFMKEIGNSMSLFGRQHKINNHGLVYRVDIVLYDKENRNFILVDLKINKITRDDIDQMQFYVEYFNENIKDDIDNNTIGLILVETKDLRVENSNDIYQIKYLNDIPKEKELLKLIRENKIILLKTEDWKRDNKHQLPI